MREEALNNFGRVRSPSPHDEGVGRGPGRGASYARPLIAKLSLSVWRTKILLSPALSSFVPQEERETVPCARLTRVLILLDALNVVATDFFRTQRQAYT